VSILKNSFAIVLAGWSLVACSSASRHERAARPASESTQPAAGSKHAPVRERSLDQMAAAERASRTSPAQAALPPGIEPGALALRSRDDPRAFLTLEGRCDRAAD
jgi:hypothetical protein